MCRVVCGETRVHNRWMRGQNGQIESTMMAESIERQIAVRFARRAHHPLQTLEEPGVIRRRRALPRCGRTHPAPCGGWCRRRRLRLSSICGCGWAIAPVRIALPRMRLIHDGHRTLATRHLRAPTCHPTTVVGHGCRSFWERAREQVDIRRSQQKFFIGLRSWWEAGWERPLRRDGSERQMDAAASWTAMVEYKNTPLDGHR